MKRAAPETDVPFNAFRPPPNGGIPSIHDDHQFDAIESSPEHVDPYIKLLFLMSSTEQELDEEDAQGRTRGRVCADKRLERLVELAKRADINKELRKLNLHDTFCSKLEGTECPNCRRMTAVRTQRQYRASDEGPSPCLECLHPSCKHIKRL